MEQKKILPWKRCRGKRKYLENAVYEEARTADYQNDGIEKSRLGFIGEEEVKIEEKND